MNIRSTLKLLFRSVGLEISRTASPAMRLKRLEWLRPFGVSTVLDVGANTGQFAATVRRALPGAYIYCFEPVRDCHTKLVARMDGDARFKAFQCALGSTDAWMEINRSAFSPSSSLLPMAQLHKEMFPHTAESHPETVRVRRLDDFGESLKLRSSVLIKVDVQGYELEVIAGGAATFSRAAVVIIETSVEQLYEGEPAFEHVLEKMQALGFSFGGVADQLLTPEGRPLQVDVIFVRRHR